MKVKNKRTLKNGAVAGYVYYKDEKKWKWRIVEGPKSGGRKKKKFKGVKIPLSNFLKFNNRQSNQSEQLNDNITIDTFNEINYDYLNHNFEYKNFKQKHNNYYGNKSGRNDPIERDIEDVTVYKFSFFDRKFILIGETHKKRPYRADYENYENMFLIPIELAKKYKKCIDVYIEDLPTEKPLFEDPRIERGPPKRIKSNTSKYSSLSLLRYKLFKLNKHPYYRLHKFDLRLLSQVEIFQILLLFNRQYTGKRGLNKMIITKIFNEYHDPQKLLSSVTSFIQTRIPYEVMRETDDLFKLRRSYRYADYTFLVENLCEIVKRIYKEYDKIPARFKTVDISPKKLSRMLFDESIFMTDIYLFYRLLMNFSTQKRNTGECKNYSERCLVFGGNAHMKNIATLFSRVYNIKSIMMYTVNIPYYTRLINNYLFEE